MPCPTCDHTMGLLVSETKFNYPIFACERCGTLVANGADGPTVYVPKLVERCRQFERIVIGRPDSIPAAVEWRTLGIAEFINLPRGRPT